jgi:predicted nucleic acid-binding protein
MAEPVPTHFLWRPQLRDPNDEVVLEAAVNGRADENESRRSRIF